MSVLVTGGAGYIGGHMVLGLLDSGEKVVVLDDLSNGFAHAVPPHATLVVGDVGDCDLVLRLMQAHQVNAVFHFAAKIVVPDSITDPLGYYLNNTSKARNLIASAVKYGVRHVIFSSTAAVYGETSGQPVDETVMPSPGTPYGRSKLAVEWMLADTAHAHKMSYVTLRYFNVAGADPGGRLGQSGVNVHLIRRAIQTALGQYATLDVFGQDYPTPDGTCIRDYIHVRDLVDAHLAALAYLREGGVNMVCNAGNGRGYSVREVIEAVKRVGGVDFKINIADRRPGDSAVVIANAELIKQKLNWQPYLHDLDLIVRHSMDWERGLMK